MESLSLKLHITKGPREGETLEYPPGSTVRIGRVVRGNNLTIKDAGISSKHLAIESRPDGPSGNSWILTDLGSSNGTIVNESTKVASDEPYVLHDGDSFKIGEYTAFLVNIEGCGGAVESRLRRNPRRRANERDLAKEVGGPVVESRAESVRVPKARGGKTKLPEAGSGAAARLVKSELVEANAVRGFESEGCGAELRNAGTAMENSGISRVSPRRTRRRKKEEDILVAGAIVEKGLEDGGLECGEKKKDEGLLNTELVQGNDEREVFVGRSLDNEQMDKGEVCGESKKSAPVEQVSVEEGGGVRSIKVEIEDDGGLEPAAGNVASSGIGFDWKETTVKSSQFPDFSKMSLREWFDYMEAYLPKQITDETEKLIAEMRTKAQRVREYVAEQNKQKGKAVS
ncbi:FHA domain-containing protein [Psidium guajava]|nr:FHA domain-containing protein [Psidium guajava]